MPDPGGDFAATSRWNSRRDVQMPRGTGADVLAGWEALSRSHLQPGRQARAGRPAPVSGARAGTAASGSTS